MHQLVQNWVWEPEQAPARSPADVKPLSEEPSHQEIIEEWGGYTFFWSNWVALSTIGEAQMGRVWTVIALCVGIVLPYNIPWRFAVAENEHKPVVLGSS